MNPILHLNLKKKWYDMIESGEKIEEYRNNSNYWMNRFGQNVKIKGLCYHPTDVIICFSNGYRKDRRQMLIKCKGLHVGYGKSEWGAEPDKQYFILSLGEKI